MLPAPDVVSPLMAMTRSTTVPMFDFTVFVVRPSFESTHVRAWFFDRFPIRPSPMSLTMYIDVFGFKVSFATPAHFEIGSYQERQAEHLSELHVVGSQQQHVVGAQQHSRVRGIEKVDAPTSELAGQLTRHLVRRSID